MRALWDEIKAAEEQAEAIVAHAREEAKSLLAKAEADVQALRKEGIEEAKRRSAAHAAERLKAAEQAAVTLEDTAKRAGEATVARAKSSLSAAVSLIRERMTR